MEVAPLDRIWSRGRMSTAARVRRLRSKTWQIDQCAVAAGVAWFVASDLLGHDTPFFAPIAAVVSLGTSYGQRLRRVAEVTLGVAIGVLVADLLVIALGTGAWQLALIVALAMTSAFLLDGGQLFVTQAAVQSIVVATLLPEPGAGLTRWSDALVGGAVALVAATVVPAAPLRRPREQAAQVVGKISALLRAAAEVMEEGEVEPALDLLADARSTDHLIRELQQAADEGLAVVASSPFRVRHRPGVRRMAELSTRWTARCARPGCSCGTRRSPPTTDGRCPRRTPCSRGSSPTRSTRWRRSWRPTGWRSPRGRRCWPSAGRRGRSSARPCSPQRSCSPSSAAWSPTCCC
ncbi:MAG TPA: FUSC family protein [Nocardioides sp.]|nr:FUSC family protein [Nocardioides sp.]